MRWSTGPAQSVLSELGVPVSPVAEICTDSSAARSFVAKRGLGGMRHLQLRDLWLQKEVGEGRIVVERVPGRGNPADLMTKFLSMPEVAERLCHLQIAISEDVASGEF